jgi:hypothetical protein
MVAGEMGPSCSAEGGSIVVFLKKKKKGENKYYLTFGCIYRIS